MVLAWMPAVISAARRGHDRSCPDRNALITRVRQMTSAASPARAKAASIRPRRIDDSRAIVAAAKNVNV